MKHDNCDYLAAPWKDNFDRIWWFCNKCGFIQQTDAA